MESKEILKISKYISFLLRHKPEAANLNIDEYGWVLTKDLINGLNNAGYVVDFDLLKKIVDSDNKSRYSFNENKSKIRANQGHSVKVDLQLKPVKPPKVLYHGTAEKYLNSILSQGLNPKSRNHVHLSSDKKTTLEVGKRHGIPIVLTIDSEAMEKDNIKFYLSENGVWLTDFVDKKYIIL